MREKVYVSITYSEFLDEIKNGNIKKITLQGTEIKGAFRVEKSTKDGIAYSTFKTSLPFEDNKLVNELVKSGVIVDVKSGSSFLTSVLPWLFPLIIFIVFWVFLMRQAQNVPKGIMSFGKSRARAPQESRSKVTFDDVAGVPEAKEELKEVIEFLKSPEKFSKLGARVPKGVILLGPPGTGKTLLAKAVAGEADVPFFSMSGSDFVELFVGVGASRVRDLFEKGKKNAPCIIFIDELDAVGRHRGAGIGGGHDEREQTLNALLVQMDGFDANEGVIVMAATNRPDVLDPALLRPGRFDRRIVVDRPDVRGREGIFKVHTRNIKVAKNVNMEVLAKTTPGFSGADIANVVNEAALLAAKKNRKSVLMKDFEEAKDKILMGAERKLILSEEEKRNIAYHESGHVLLSKFTKEADPVHKVTIIPRGIALGVTQPLPVDNRHNFSREYCLAQIDVLLGGRGSEIEVLGTVTTGAGNDIEKATELARKMVCEWGMSEKLGPLTFGKKQEEIFLGREIARHRDYSEETAKKIDEEVRKIIDKSEKRVITIIKEHIKELHLLAKALLEKEVLTGDEIDKLIAHGQKKNREGS
jgi:cell division protease FtsH